MMADELKSPLGAARVLLGCSEMGAMIERLASEIETRRSLHGVEPLALVGIRSRGDVVAERIRARLEARGVGEVSFGILDISLYRDDLGHLTVNPKLEGSEITFAVDGAHVILVDDVLFTGRTIRAALDAVTDYGRPSKIELAVLIDRGHRELPIQPDYVGACLELERMDRVRVHLVESDGQDAVLVTS